MEDSNLFPNIHNAQDSIFNHCVVNIKEFPQYITNLEDILYPAHTRFLSRNFSNLNLDTVWMRRGNRLVNIEHHSYLDLNLLKRDCDYITTLIAQSKLDSSQVIFYTGNRDIPHHYIFKILCYMNRRLFQQG